MPLPRAWDAFKGYLFHVVSFVASLGTGALASYSMPSSPYEIGLSMVVAILTFGMLEFLQIVQLVRVLHRDEEAYRATATAELKDLAQIKGHVSTWREEIALIKDNTVRIAERAEEVRRIRRTGNRLAQELVLTQEQFQFVAEDKRMKGFFIDQIVEDARELKLKVTDLAQRKTLRVTNNHLRKIDDIIEFLTHDSKPCWLFTWVIDAGERLFEVQEWRDFFIEMVNHARQTAGFQVATVLVIDATEEGSERFDMLKELYRNSGDFRLCVIDRETYSRRRDQIPLLENCEDFAVFGDSVIFKALKYEPIIEAEYCFDREVVDAFRVLFNQLTQGYVLEKIEGVESRTGPTAMAVVQHELTGGQAQGAAESGDTGSTGDGGEGEVGAGTDGAE